MIYTHAAGDTFTQRLCCILSLVPEYSLEWLCVAKEGLLVMVCVRIRRGFVITITMT